MEPAANMAVSIAEQLKGCAQYSGRAANGFTRLNDVARELLIKAADTIEGLLDLEEADDEEVKRLTAENEQVRNKLCEFETIMRALQEALEHVDKYGPGSTCLDGFAAGIRKLLESTS